MTVVLIVEGGGHQNKQAAIALRQGFRRLFERAGLAAQKLKIQSGGGRHNAFGDFETAVAAKETGTHCLLLVDSEGPISEDAEIWTVLNELDGWKKPSGCDDDDIHLMVQCMESWFIADPDALLAHYKRDFRAGALPKHAQPEQVDKPQIEKAIRAAIKECKNNKYDKGSDSFAILAQCNPDVLREKMPFFRRLCDRLEGLLGSK